jgi:hypothetical protein
MSKDMPQVGPLLRGWITTETFANNSRVKKFKIETGNGFVMTAALELLRGWKGGLRIFRGAMLAYE